MAELEHWENRYVQGDTPWDSGRPSSELIRVLDENAIAPCTAIDLGCGTGSNAVYLAERGFTVTGLDISPSALDQGRSKKARAAVKVRYVLGDVLDPPEDLGGPFDFLFDRGCYHVVRRVDLDRYLATVEKITRPGSRGLILTGNAREKREDKGPPAVPEEELRSEVGKLFDFEKLVEFRFDPIRGPEDRPLGWSCLVKRR